MPPLADDLLLVVLSPAEGRNTRRHDGIRAAVLGAAMIEEWLAGASLGDPKAIRKRVRKQNYNALEPALARLYDSGQIVSNRPPPEKRSAVRTALLPTGSLAIHGDTLVDVRAGEAVRGRLRTALADESPPDPRDAGLAVLLYTGRLWNWSGLEPPQTEEIRVFGKRKEPHGPLKARAAELAAAKDTIAAIGRAVDHEYRNYSG
jgi:hypothetical protein